MRPSARQLPLLLALAIVPSTGCETGSATAGADSTAAVSAPTDNTTPSIDSAQQLSAKPAPANKLQDKTFDDIKFDIQPGDPFARDMLTPKIEELDGKRIRIRGWILPTAQKRGLKQFVLVRDNMECCFGPGAALYDCILIEMQPGTTAEFSTSPVAVTGEFAIRVLPGPGGTPLAIYRMQGESVE
jgi:hypothetical protein